jgi:hypothetical protein
MNLLHRLIDAAIGQTGEADLAVRVVAAEILQPIVVDAQTFVRGLGIVQLGRGAEDAADDLSIDTLRRFRHWQAQPPKFYRMYDTRELSSGLVR